jgi:hypothetical protein
VGSLGTDDHPSFTGRGPLQPSVPTLRPAVCPTPSPLTSQNSLPCPSPQAGSLYKSGSVFFGSAWSYRDQWAQKALASGLHLHANWPLGVGMPPYTHTLLAGPLCSVWVAGWGPQQQVGLPSLSLPQCVCAPNTRGAVEGEVVKALKLEG